MSTEELEEQAAINRRRVRIIHIAPREIALHFGQPKCEFLAMPDIPTLPKDFRVDAVNYDYRFDAFALRVWSMEFSPTEEWVEIPVIPAPLQKSVSVYRRPKDE